MSKATWPVEEFQFVLQLWQQGLSGEEISKQIKGKRSRSAVIAELNRRGFKRGKKSNPPKQKQHRVHSNPDPPRSTIILPNKPILIGEPIVVDVAPPPKPYVPETSDYAVALLDATSKQCHWPLDGGLCCGATVYKEFSYCHNHCRIMYRKNI